GEDGFLSPADLAALRLNANLVVLSACRTAGGVIVAGEGVQGLTAPLLEAGGGAGGGPPGRRGACRAAAHGGGGFEGGGGGRGGWRRRSGPRSSPRSGAAPHHATGRRSPSSAIPRPRSS